MFERRLKVFLSMLFLVVAVLLGRAFQLQVLGCEDWQKQAESVGRKRHLVETTRGTIVDCKNREIALDVPCIDACVEYKAIAKDPEWVKCVALKRLAAQGREYHRADEKTRAAMLKQTTQQVLSEIDAMFAALAHEAKQPPEKIEETRMAIEQRVQMRARYVQYKRYRDATTQAAAKAATQPTPWYRKLLTAGTRDTVTIDSFARRTDDEDSAHPIIRNISTETYTRLAKAIDRYPGLVLRQGAYRKYPYGAAGCHVIGMLGVALKPDIESGLNEKDDELREMLPNDLIGRGGLEQLGETTLRGTRGYVEFPSGKRDEIVEEKRAVAGGAIKSSIDIELQGQIQNLFAHTQVQSNHSIKVDKRTVEVPMHGAAVVIDVKTAEVRALASYPDYDLNTAQDEFDVLAKDWLNAPLMNRATQSQREPGSTVKPIVGMGAITEGLWTTTKGIECTGYLVIRGRVQANGKCWMAGFLHDPDAKGMIAHHCWPIAHKGTFGNPDGFLTFSEALERSCNVYFETLADLMGAQRLGYWFDRFGLGHETGIGIAEARGAIPRAEDQNSPSLVWFSGIGQTRVRATPIQMANVAATIARNGVWMRPKLVIDGVNLTPTRLKDGRVLPERLDLKIAPDAVKAAQEGMVKVVNSEAGTGPHARMEELLIAGKTGTAQGHAEYELDESGHARKDASGKKIPLAAATIDKPTSTPWYRGWGDDGTKTNHAWFMCFAPANDPKVAVAVLVEYGGPGGMTAGGIARHILTACAEHGYLEFKK